MNEETVKTSLYQASEHLLEAAKILTPVNFMMGMMILKQAELLAEFLDNNKSINIVEEISDEIKNEIDKLVDELDKQIGE